MTDRQNLSGPSSGQPRVEPTVGGHGLTDVPRTHLRSRKGGQPDAAVYFEKEGHFATNKKKKAHTPTNQP